MNRESTSYPLSAGLALVRVSLLPLHPQELCVPPVPQRWPDPLQPVLSALSQVHQTT